MSVVCVASGIPVGSLYCWVLWKLKEVSTTRRSSILLSPAVALFHIFCIHVYCCKGNGSVTFSFISALLWTAHLQMDSLPSGLHLQRDFPIISKITSFNVNKCFLLMYFIPSGQISVVWWLWGKCHFLSHRLICAYFFLKDKFIFCQDWKHLLFSWNVGISKTRDKNVLGSTFLFAMEKTKSLHR